MEFLGSKSKGNDPDVWMRPTTQNDDVLVYDYVLLYINNCLVVSGNVEDILKKKIGKYLELKSNSSGPPNLYLGSYLQEVQLDSGTKAWAFSST